MKAQPQPKPKKNNTVLYTGIALLTIGAVAAATSSGSKSVPLSNTQEPAGNNSQPAPTQPANGGGGSSTPTMNLNLVLKNGSKGLEVRELQKLLKVGIDGDFGPLTEAALYSVRSVKQISVNQFNSTPVKVPPVPQTPYAKGQKVMASLRTGCRMYAVAKNAAGQWFIKSNEHDFVEAFGKGLGKITAVLTASGQYFYVVESAGILSNNYYAVRHTECKAY